MSCQDGGLGDLVVSNLTCQGVWDHGGKYIKN